MAKKPNTLLRILVPVLILTFGVGAVLIAINRQGTLGGGSTPAVPATPAAAGATQGAPTPPVAATPGAPAPTTPPTATPAAAGGTPAAPPTPARRLKARSLAGQPDTGPFTPIGAVEPARGQDTTPMEMLIAFSPLGAGIESLQLADQWTTIGSGGDHETLQLAVEHQGQKLVPFAMLGVTIDGQGVDLSGSPDPVWRQTAPGAFEATIVDEAGAEVARIYRRYTLEPGAHDVLLEQGLENLTSAPMAVRWRQLGPGDLPIGVVRYGGDVRRVHFGYLPPPGPNPTGQVVSARDTLVPHATAMGTMNAVGRNPTERWQFTTTGEPRPPLWPTPDSAAAGKSLVWAALTNRFFAVAVHSLPERLPPRADTVPPGGLDKRFSLVERIDRVVLERGATASEVAKDSLLALRLSGAESVVPAGGRFDASMGVYAGPLAADALAAHPRLQAVGLDELVVFTFGGPCGICTFQPVARGLRSFLGFLHDRLVFDWTLSIMLLVVCVRTVLHPVTRWSQANLTRFGKQMQALAPKQAKLKEKYGNDPAKLREESAKLMREENINFAGALGCLPMLLQTPIWMALYAMIFFTYELRHEAGFYGLFQWISGGSWAFLGDLSEPDKLIPLPFSLEIPLISSLMGAIESINLLPVLMGVMFYIQQKYLSPPQTATLSPEMELNQKITKVMIVVLFPLFMYNAPAALVVYFLTNSSLGILESKWIRAKVEREDAARALLPKPPRGSKPDGPKSFLQRIQEGVEERQKQIDEARRRANRK